MEVIKRKSEVEKLDLREYVEESIKKKVLERLKKEGINTKDVENISINFLKIQVSFNSDGHLVFRFFPSTISVYFKSRSITDFRTYDGRKLGIDVLFVLNASETNQVIHFIKNYVLYQ